MSLNAETGPKLYVLNSYKNLQLIKQIKKDMYVLLLFLVYILKKIQLENL